jgi:hypothetical protein
LYHEGIFQQLNISFENAGQAVGGIFPVLVDILVTLVRVREQDVGFACFTIATLVLVLFSLQQSESGNKQRC